MNSKFVKLLPALAIVIGAIAMSIFFFDVSIETPALLILFGTIATVIALLFIAYAKPSNWLLNQRFLLLGLVFCFFILVSVNLVQNQLYRIFHWSFLLVWIVLGISCGFYSNGNMCKDR